MSPFETESNEALRQPLDIVAVRAMAVRNQQEMALFQAAAGTKGLGREIGESVLDKVTDGATKYTCEVLEGEHDLNLTDLVMSGLREVDLETWRESVGDDGLDDEEVALLEDLTVDAADAAFRLLEPLSRNSTSKVRAQFELAKGLAVELGIPLATVFDDEATYLELLRRQDTPATFAEPFAETLQGINESTTMEFFWGYLRATTKFEEGLTDKEADAEIAEMKADGDPLIDTELAEVASDMRRHIATAALSQLERIWGPDALQSLPEDLRLELEASAQPKPVVVPVVKIGGFALLGAAEQQVRGLKEREAFVNGYLAAKGWNVDDLTIEQIMEIRSQDGWKIED